VILVFAEMLRDTFLGMEAGGYSPASARAHLWMRLWRLHATLPIFFEDLTQLPMQTVDGTLTVPGGQRDYVLTFESAEQRALFAEVLSLHTWSTPRVHGMNVEFNVMKKVNKMTW
jgi:hypothetical protein